MSDSLIQREDYLGKIREIENFPKPGVSFKDITTLLKDGPSYRAAIDEIASFAASCEADVIVGPEARGFVIGAPVAYALKKGFVPVRKAGKLPAETVEIRYDLEYGSDTLAVHKDGLQHGARVVVVDDLLATGGTVQSTVELVRLLGAEVVGASFLIELTFLKGRERLPGVNIFSLVQYD